jgi:glyoxylate/hydroxypyruvate reductase A
MIRRQELQAMRRRLAMSIARGPVVNERAGDALQAQRISGAILTSSTPSPCRGPSLALPGVITPHISGPSTPEELTPVFTWNLARYLAGQPLHHVVDRARGY